MKPLHEMYADVVAKRPELAVPHLVWDTSWGDDLEYWKHRDRFVGDEAPEALILAHWIGKLPDGHGLMRERDGFNVGSVFCDEWHPFAHGVKNADTPLAALYAFFTTTPTPPAVAEGDRHE